MSRQLSYVTIALPAVECRYELDQQKQTVEFHRPLAIIILSIMDILTIIILTSIWSLTCQAAGINILEQLKYKQALATQGLYTLHDNIEILTKNNFKSSLYNKKHAWLIEFYSSWCGHCKNFAPTWKEFATSVYNWNKIVTIGAIDCADDKNNDICRDCEILAYPTIKYFHEDYQYEPNKIGLMITKSDSSQELTRLLLDKLREDQNNGFGRLWPNLTVQNFSNAAEIWDNVSPTIQVVFLIFEPVESTTGAQVILDLHDISNIKVWRISDRNNLVKILSVTDFPALYALDKYSYNPHAIPSGSTRIKIRNSIVNYLHYSNVNIPKNFYDWLYTSSSQRPTLPNNLSISVINPFENMIYQADLETGLRYTLSHEITRLKYINGDALIALKNYLKVLMKHFPFKANGEIFVTKLLDEIESRDEWLGEDLSDLIASLEMRYSPVYSTILEWIGCQGSSSNYRGFTCSLWTIFHTLTVASAGKNSDDASEVLRAMLGYVKHFFGCAECSEHFQAMAVKNKLQSVAENDGTILWLWVAHNEVNHRLAGDKTEDPQHPKRQFPLAKECPKCRHANGNWDFEQVLMFLKYMYGVDNLNLMKTVAHQTSPASHLSNFDMVIICVLRLYCVILFFFILRLFFMKKNYKKKLYAHDMLGKV